MAKSCPGAIVFKEARPDYVECPYCGGEMEVWSDEPLARCPHCHLWVSKERGASCIDWCKFAAECVGLEAYERLRKDRPPEELIGDHGDPLQGASAVVRRIGVGL